MMTEKEIETSEANTMVQNANTYVENMDIQNAIPLYISASEIYLKHNQIARFSDCAVRAARFCIQFEYYEVAIGLLEKVVTKNADNSLTKWANSEYLMNAMLIHILQNNYDENISKYQEMLNHTYFLSVREGIFIKELQESIVKGDEKMYTDTVKGYDEITRLDPLKVTMLLRIKNKFFHVL